MKTDLGVYICIITTRSHFSYYYEIKCVPPEKIELQGNKNRGLIKLIACWSDTILPGRKINCQLMPSSWDCWTEPVCMRAGIQFIHVVINVFL